jgi:hypothetical protein
MKKKMQEGQEKKYNNYCVNVARVLPVDDGISADEEFGDSSLCSSFSSSSSCPSFITV